MSIRITHIHLESGIRDHEHISEVKWVSRESGDTNISTRRAVVDWIDGGGKAYVGTGALEVPVAAVHPATGPAYLRSHADGVWTNNLLALEEF